MSDSRPENDVMTTEATMTTGRMNEAESGSSVRLHPVVSPIPFVDSIVHGDNCDVLGQLPRNCIDLVVTSPPYDDLRTYGDHSWDFYGVAWQLKRVLKPGGVIVWVVADATKDGSETGTSMRQALHFQTLGLNLHDTMVWHKINAMPLNSNRYESAWEYVFVLSNGKPKAWNPVKEKSVAACEMRKGSQIEADGTRKPKWGNAIPVNEWKVKQNVMPFAVGGGTSGHPAVFPDDLAMMAVQTWSDAGDVVLDPFSGSGTTCKAAKELNRHYIGIEINETYIKIGNARTAQDVLAL